MGGGYGATNKEIEVDAMNIDPLALVPLKKIVYSSGAQDLLISDFDAAQISIDKFGGTYVHRGFYNYTSAIFEFGLEGDIKDYHSNKNFYVCGHSLGGGSAVIASAILKEDNPSNQLRLYTYGCPRTGTVSFVERYRSIVHHRHVNDHDVVAQIPMKWVNTNPDKGSAFNTLLAMMTGIGGMVYDWDDDNYHHHGQLTQLLTYDKRNQILLSPRHTHVPFLDVIKSEDEDAFALLNDLDFPIGNLIGDHDMGLYINNLAKILTQTVDGTMNEYYKGAIEMLEDLKSRSLLKFNEYRMELLGARQNQGAFIASTERYMYLRHKQDLLKALIIQYQKIYMELKDLINNTDPNAIEKLFSGNQLLPKFVKDQI